MAATVALYARPEIIRGGQCAREVSPFRNGPIRTLADLEEITSAWVHWYNTERLMHRLGRRPPAEAGRTHHEQPGYRGAAWRSRRPVPRRERQLAGARCEVAGGGERAWLILSSMVPHLLG